jgi:hypothetical protein
MGRSNRKLSIRDEKPIYLPIYYFYRGVIVPFFENLRNHYQELEKQSFDKALSENLCNHLSSLSIESKIVSPGTPECIQSISQYGRNISILGCVKINGFHFDQIGVIRQTISQSRNNPGNNSSIGDRFAIFYSYLVNIPPGLLRKELNIKIDTIKKGLFNKETIDYEWKGGGLANRLNSDVVLMMKIRNHKQNPPDGFFQKLFPWMTVQSLKEDDFITLRQLVHDPMDYPPREGIEIADRVSKHIRTMIQGMP